MELPADFGPFVDTLRKDFPQAGWDSKPSQGSGTARNEAKGVELQEGPGPHVSYVPKSRHVLPGMMGSYPSWTKWMMLLHDKACTLRGLMLLSPAQGDATVSTEPHVRELLCVRGPSLVGAGTTTCGWGHYMTVGSFRCFFKAATLSLPGKYFHKIFMPSLETVSIGDLCNKAVRLQV